MNYDLDQVLNDFVALNQTVEMIRQKLAAAGISYESQDARQVALEGLQCDIGACGQWIKTLMSLKCMCQNSFHAKWEEEYRIRMGTGLDVGQSEDLMLDYLRNTLTTKIHFKIENLFTNILMTFSVKKLRGFSQISDATLGLAGLSTSGREKRTLTVLANLRNSYHANGMHNNSDLSIQIDGINFDFVKGKRVECAGWRHIVTVIQSNISVLEAVLFSATVSNHPMEIVDEFAATNP